MKKNSCFAKLKDYFCQIKQAVTQGKHVKRMNDFLQKYGKIIPQERG